MIPASTTAQPSPAPIILKVVVTSAAAPNTSRSTTAASTSKLLPPLLALKTLLSPLANWLPTLLPQPKLTLLALALLQSPTWQLPPPRLLMPQSHQPSLSLVQSIQLLSVTQLSTPPNWQPVQSPTPRSRTLRLPTNCWDGPALVLVL